MVVASIRIVRFELFDLRLFGSPDLANLIEIPIAAALGFLSAAGLAIAIRMGRIREERFVSRWVITTYIATGIFFFLMPGLPH